jgi:hypothetical protein
MRVDLSFEHVICFLIDYVPLAPGRRAGGRASDKWG